MKLILKDNRGIFDTKTITNNKRAVIEVEHDYRFFNIYASIISNDSNVSHLVKIVDDTLIIEKDLLMCGKLYIKIKIMTRDNQVVKVIPCDSLTIREANKDIELIPQVVELEEQVDNLKRSVNKMLKVVNAMCNINIVLNQDGSIRGENV